MTTQTASKIKVRRRRRQQPPENSSAASLASTKGTGFHAGQNCDKEFTWCDDDFPAVNYEKLGARLAKAGDLFRRPRYGEGLLRLLRNKQTVEINAGTDLTPVVCDRLNVTVLKNGKHTANMIPRSHWSVILKSERFLKHFRIVDCVAREAICMPDFSWTVPGYNDGGEGNRVFYVGDEPSFSDSLDYTNRFLGQMAFATNADRTNAVAGLLTVILRNHWPGGKPILAVTATKSHAGKDTVIAFMAGLTKQVSISYQATDWPLQQQLFNALKHSPDSGVVVVENARLKRKEPYIQSATIERFVTDPEPFLSAPSTGAAKRISNDIVVAMSTNDGMIGEDLMNRALPIHLAPVGDVAERHSEIGNPKLEFLPKYASNIAAEGRGMIEKWKRAGMPLDDDVKHPFTEWTKVIGGILKANGLTDFLANYAERKSTDDPLKQALGHLGVENANEWLRPSDWASRCRMLGLTKRIIPLNDRYSEAGCCRGIGVVLTKHDRETFHVETDDTRTTLRLEGGRKRFDGQKPHKRYRFVRIGSVPIPADNEDEPVTEVDI